MCYKLDETYLKYTYEQREKNSDKIQTKDKQQSIKNQIIKKQCCNTQQMIFTTCHRV